MRVSVIGQGYVGLPLAIAAAKSGFEVDGVDTDLDKIEKIMSGNSGISGFESGLLNKLIEGNSYFCFGDFSRISLSEIVIFCVPTPLDSTNKPDLSILLDAINQVGKNLKKGTLVIIESTIAPGTTSEILEPLLLKVAGLESGDLDISYSPERIDPMNLDWDVTNTPKLVAGLTVGSLKRAMNFYSKFIKEVIPVKSVKIAETAKLLENSFRLVNISFINEIAVFCNKYGIDITEVIKAASTKPYGFMPFYPSLGVGGHCIPVDPIYLSDKAKQVGTPLTMIDKASQINNEMPAYYVRRAGEKINGLKGKKILILGLAYKPNISDTRESPVEPLINGLRDKGAIVEWHDDLVGEWNGEKSVALGANYDLAILATPHDYFDLSKLGNVPTLDTRGSL
jgi:UDP-N-acetyl-D-glucosamine dehydrogenase